MSDPRIVEDVWLDILKRLPVKTLGKCRCVSKFWDALIVSPHFLAAHLKCYTQNKANSLLLYKHLSLPPLKEEQYTIFKDSADGKCEEPDVVHSFTCPLVPDRNPYHFKLIGSINGLLLLSDEYSRKTSLLLLWNPLLHKYIILPEPLASLTPDQVAKDCSTVFGFGYDPIKCDYKVVKVTYFQDKDGLDETPPQAEVYSVQEEKWKGLSTRGMVDICICQYKWSQCFVDGCIHWVSWKIDAKSRLFVMNCLLIFDVQRERFGMMFLPDHLQKVSTLNIRVSEYRGELAIYHSVKRGVSMREVTEFCQIWVKKQAIGQYRVHSINLDETDGLSWVQSLWKDEQFLGFTEEGNLVAYDPEAKKTVGLGLRGRLNSWFTFSYSESLCLLDKKTGVYTYDAAGNNKKKRYGYRSFRGSIKLTEEEVEDSCKDEDQPVCLSKDPEDRRMRGDQLMKLGGGLINLQDFAASQWLRNSVG